MIYENNERLKEGLLNVVQEISPLEYEFLFERGKSVLQVIYSADTKYYTEYQVIEKDVTLERIEKELIKKAKEASIELVETGYHFSSWGVEYTFKELSEKVINENKLDKFEIELNKIKAKFPHLDEKTCIEIALKLF